MNPLDAPHLAHASVEDLHLAHKRTGDAIERQRIDLELTRRQLAGTSVVQDPEWGSVRNANHPPRPEEPKAR